MYFGLFARASRRSRKGAKVAFISLASIIQFRRLFLDTVLHKASERLAALGEPEIRAADEAAPVEA